MNPLESTTVTQLSNQQNEPEWLLEQRKQALELSTQLPLPKLERTSIQKWNFDDFQLGNEEEPLTRLDQLPEEISPFLSDEEQANIIVQRNQQSHVQQLDPSLQEQGVIFTDLATAVREHEEKVKPYLFSTLDKNQNKLYSMHQALWSGGLFLYVPRNQEVTVPFQSLFWLSGEKAGMFPHILVVAEDNSRVELVTNFVSLHEEKSAVNNAVLEVFVGQNAKVRVATVNNHSPSVVDVVYRQGVVGRDGELEWIIGDFSSGRVISDNSTDLKGEGGNVKIKSVIMGAEELRSNVTSTVNHQAKHTASDILARSVMKDQATSILNSITKIEKGASKSDGQQSGKVLMLNPKARGDANPILLIDENDVVAGHAASVGRVDPLQMFYLMSRGISKTEAEKLIVFGFLGAVVSEIPSESLRKQLHQVIERKFQS